MNSIEEFLSGPLTEAGPSAKPSDSQDTSVLPSSLEHQQSLVVEGRQQSVDSGTTNVDAPEFYGNQSPAHELKSEKPHHRLICMLAAQGYNNKEIAELMGVTPAMVAYTRKQPWALKNIVDLQEKCGRKAVMQVLKDACPMAVKTLVEIANPESKVFPNVRAIDRGRIAEGILDRVFGTAPQTVLHGTVDPSELTDEELSATVATGTQ